MKRAEEDREKDDKEKPPMRKPHQHTRRVTKITEKDGTPVLECTTCYSFLS